MGMDDEEEAVLTEMNAANQGDAADTEAGPAATTAEPMQLDGTEAAVGDAATSDHPVIARHGVDDANREGQHIAAGPALGSTLQPEVQASAAAAAPAAAAPAATAPANRLDVLAAIAATVTELPVVQTSTQALHPLPRNIFQTVRCLASVHVCACGCITLASLC